MRSNRRVWLALLGCCSALQALGAEVTVNSITVQATLPVIQWSNSGTQLLVAGADERGNKFDLTDRATIEVTPADSGKVDASRWLTPLRDGQMTVTARYGDRSATVTVEATSTHIKRPTEFRNDVLPALTRAGCNSGACHGTPTGKNGFKLSLRSYLPEQDHVSLTREFNGRRVDVLDPDASLILLKGSGAILHQGGQRFTSETPTYQVIRRWIAEGCLPDRPTTPSATKLRLLYSSAILDLPADSERMAVQAEFSNGELRDVSRLARFASSDETVAQVDTTGRVKRLKKGEVIIQASYGPLVETARLLFRDRDVGLAWVDPPTNNFVDELIARKWKELRIPPSELADDATFARRVYFDVIGLPPSPQELQRFLASTDPLKRARLIDALLERPEYVDFWTLKWVDRLGCNQRFTGFKGAYAYYRWIRDQIAENVPFDRFAKTIITARGANYTNPPASFYRRVRTPEDAAETVSQLFMGVRIQCAKCHNHVAEKWTQDDYYGFAAFFSQLRYKDGPQFFELYNKEETVYIKPDAEIRHPRTGKVVSARALGALPPADSIAFDRREALADWLASPTNPFFAKAAVNRIWFHLFGRGIVEPVDDLRESNLAASPALLANLADDFVEHNFDSKHTLRTILNSRTYQLASKSNPANREDVRYFTHAQVRLLSAERLLDAIVNITEVPEQFFHLPAGTTAAQIPDGEFAHPFLRSFGQPRRSEACECEREPDSTLDQALQMIGGRTVHAKIRRPDNRLGRLLKAGKSNDEIIDDLYLACLARLADASEKSIALAAFTENDQNARRQTAEDLLWTLFNHPEFLFQH